MNLSNVRHAVMSLASASLLAVLMLSPPAAHAAQETNGPGVTPPAGTGDTTRDTPPADADRPADSDATPANSSGTELVQQLESAAERLTEKQYELRYKFEAGEVLRYSVVHLATTDTRIQGNTQTAKTRTVSTKNWTVEEVDDEGNMSFVHMVEDIDMWQKISGRPEVKFNSRTDEIPPPEYAEAAKTVGVPLARITVTPTGRVVARDQEANPLHMGLGQILIPFPEQPLKIGEFWYVPREIRVRQIDQRVKIVKTRQKFTLVDVKTGVATLEVKTQVITPVNDPRIESQLVQEMLDGTIKFDLDAGRMLSRQVDWDATVLQFNGGDSMMKYRARFTEDLVSNQAGS